LYIKLKHCFNYSSQHAVQHTGPALHQLSPMSVQHLTLDCDIDT